MRIGCSVKILTHSFYGNFGRPSLRKSELSRGDATEGDAL